MLPQAKMSHFALEELPKARRQPCQKERKTRLGTGNQRLGTGSQRKWLMVRQLRRDAAAGQGH